MNIRRRGVAVAVVIAVMIFHGQLMPLISAPWVGLLRGHFLFCRFTELERWCKTD
jgi:hypothetical protein